MSLASVSLTEKLALITKKTLGCNWILTAREKETYEHNTYSLDSVCSAHVT